MIKRTHYSCSEPNFDVQHPHGGSQLTGTAVTRNPNLSSHLLSHQASMWCSYRHTYGKITHIHKLIKCFENIFRKNILKNNSFYLITVTISILLLCWKHLLVLCKFWVFFVKLGVIFCFYCLFTWYAVSMSSIISIKKISLVIMLKSRLCFLSVHEFTNKPQHMLCGYNCIANVLVSSLSAVIKNTLTIAT